MKLCLKWCIKACRRPLLLGLGLFVLAAQVQALGCPARVRVAFLDVAAEPLLNGDGAAFVDPPGLAVDWLRRSLQRLGCWERTQLVRLPARRIKMLLQTGGDEIDMVAGVTEGTPNAADLRLPPPAASPQDELSVGRIDYALYATASSFDGWDGRRLHLQAEQRVGVVQGTAAEQIAVAMGWPLELAPSYPSALQKVLAGRSTLLFSVTMHVDSKLHSQAPLTLRRLEPPVLSRRIHLGAVPGFYERERPFVEALWRETCLEGNALRAQALRCPLPQAMSGPATR